MRGGTIISQSLNLSPALEDYLESILELSKRDEAVRVTDLAAKLEVAKASVTEAVNKLAGLRLVKQERYGPVRLTELGKEEARRVRYRHRVIETFLREVLNIPAKVAAKDACLMEHVVSPVTIERLAGFLRSRIENQAHDMAEQYDEEGGEVAPVGKSVKSLSELSAGMKGTVLRVASKGKLRRRILDMGVVPGAEVCVDGVAPFGDPLQLTVRGYHLSLRKSEAADVYVEVD